MKQTEIKIPLTCEQLAYSIWISFSIIATTIGLIYWGGFDEVWAFWLFGFGFSSGLVFVFLFAEYFIEWLREKPRLPFKFVCRCDNN